MKTVIQTTKTLILALALFFLADCDNPEIDDKEEIPEGWKSLDEIAGNPAYPSLSLTGIRWKLIGFADEEKNIIRPVTSSTYVIYFRVDGLIGGNIYVSKVSGTYSSDGTNLLAEVSLERVTEHDADADLYMEALNDTDSYQLTEKGLKLYYEDHQYLLFKCAFDDRCLQTVNCGEEDYSDKTCIDEAINGTWKAHKIRLNITGSLCEVMPPPLVGPGYSIVPYPDISIEIYNTTNGYGFDGNTFFNWIKGATIEISEGQQIMIKGGAASRSYEEDWGISFMENIYEETAAYCLSGNELIFLDAKDQPVIVFAKK